MTVSELASATGIPVGKLCVFMSNYTLLTLLYSLKTLMHCAWFCLFLLCIILKLNIIQLRLSHTVVVAV